MVDNVTDIELGTLTSSGWDTSSAPVFGTGKVASSASDPTVNADTRLGLRVGDSWFNTATGNVFDAISVASGAAIWRHRPRVWASGASATGAADTAENTLATIALPAGVMGVNGILTAETLLTITSSGNNKTLRTKLGATDYGAVTITTSASYRERRQIQNRNSAAAQVAWIQANGASWGGAAGANVTGTENTANALNLLITGQKASAGETFTLESWMVTLTRPDIGP